MIESKSAECRHLVTLPSHCAASLQLSSVEHATTLRVFSSSVANGGWNQRLVARMKKGGFSMALRPDYSLIGE